MPVTLQDTTTTRMMAVGTFLDANLIKLLPGGGKLSSESVHELHCGWSNGWVYGPFSGDLAKSFFKVP